MHSGLCLRVGCVVARRLKHWPYGRGSCTSAPRAIRSRRCRVVPETVRTWRRRLLDRGLDGMCDEPRPGVPRKITDADVERVIRRAGRSLQAKTYPPQDPPRPRRVPSGGFKGQVAAEPAHASIVSGSCEAVRDPPYESPEFRYDDPFAHDGRGMARVPQRLQRQAHQLGRGP
ncbi:helix-turn-helix domain-containing protein [Streptomyces sp. NPDC049967]|uniref:helix-turn-helix domain-containing protein n=2 Tax=Streptomyces TaxID=1883 RepID=UPI00343B2236